MDIYVARQPIFDRNIELFGYELLYRDGTANSYGSDIDDDTATARVLMNSFLEIGFEQITDSSQAFVNFGEETLKNGSVFFFKSDGLIVEILENVAIDRQIRDICVSLKEKGYKVAIDDAVWKDMSRYEEILDYVDIVKVDFSQNNPDERKKIIARYKRSGLKFLAEKVETKEEFNRALKDGYDYFQGYFFSKPVVVKAKKMSSYKIRCFEILEELHAEEPDYQRLSDLVERDVNLAYKFLRITNSPIFYFKSKITSIKQALVYLGIKEITRFISMLLMHDLKDEKPDELIKMALVRGKMCELVSEKTTMSNRKSEMFLMGIFSLMDVMLDKKMCDIIEELPLKDDVKTCLLKNPDQLKSAGLSDILDLVKNYEKGCWDDLKSQQSRLEVLGEIVTDCYIEAIKWAHEVVNIC